MKASERAVIDAPVFDPPSRTDDSCGASTATINTHNAENASSTNVDDNRNDMKSSSQVSGSVNSTGVT